MLFFIWGYGSACWLPATSLWTRWILRLINDNRIVLGQKCYKCNRVGHLARDCQETEERCYRCNDVGHKSRECNREKDQISCYNCKEVGHLVKDCPTKVDVCFACNLEGHISRKILEFHNFTQLSFNISPGNCPSGTGGRPRTTQRQ